MVELDHVPNTKMVKVHAMIATKYRFVDVRGIPILLQPSKLRFFAMEKVGDTNLNLYLDYTIYLIDLVIGKRSNF